MNRRPFTIGHQIAGVFGAAILLLLVLSAGSYERVDAMLRMSRAVAGAIDILGRLDGLLSALHEAESAQRGFLLTGDERRLEPYRAAVAAIDERFHALKGAVHEGQAEKVERIRAPIDAKLARLRDGIAARQRGGIEAAARFAAGDEDKRTTDAILAAASALASEEQGHVHEHGAASEDLSRSVTRTFAAGFSLTALVMVALAVLVVRGLNRRIGSAVQQVRGSSAALHASSAQLVMGAKEQVSAATEVAGTIKQLLSAARQIADGAQRVTAVAAATSAAARAGESTVNTARRAIWSVRTQVDQVLRHMLDLGLKSREIGGILDIINELSDQTNILAINATIEAAGAGDAGLRFAVVADEIRKLADRVGGSTKEIRALIEQIRTASSLTVAATQDGSKAVDAGTQEFGEVAVSFSQIVELVASTADASEEIELSTKQQTLAVEQVNLVVAEVARSAKEAEVSLTQTLLTASQLASLSRDLARLVHAEGGAP